MRYDIDTVRFTFEHYVTLSHGKWPDPKHEEIEVRAKGTSYHAPFENPAITAAEVGRRVKVCSTDGLVVEIVYGMLLGVPWGAELYAKMYHHDLQDVYRRINKVAWYCTDEEYFKRLPYESWKRKSQTSRHFQQRINQKV